MYYDKIRLLRNNIKKYLFVSQKFWCEPNLWEWWVGENKTVASDDIATTVVCRLLLAVVVQQKNEEGEEGVLKSLCFPLSIIFLYF